MGKLYMSQIRGTTNAQTNKDLVKSFFSTIPEITLKYEGVENNKHYLIYEVRFSSSKRDALYPVFVFSSSAIYSQMYLDLHASQPYSPFMSGINWSFSNRPGEYLTWVDNGHTIGGSAISTSQDTSLRYYFSDELVHINIGGYIVFTILRPGNLPAEADRGELTYLPYVSQSEELRVLDGIKQRKMDGSSAALISSPSQGRAGIYQAAWLMYPGNPSLMIPNSADGNKRMVKFNLPIYSGVGKLGELGENIMVGASSGIAPFVDRVVTEDGKNYVLIPGISNVPSLFARID